MQIVILAGGLGTRLQSVAPNTPKAMVPVAGIPFIEHQLTLLKKNGLEEVLLCTGHFGEQIESHVRDGSSFGMKVLYSREDPRNLLGTGGALVNAFPHLQEHFMLMYGDSYLPVDFQSMLTWYKKHHFPALMSVFKNEGLWDRSNVRIAGDRIAYYSKTALEGECDHIDYGLLIFKKETIASYVSHLLPLDLAQIQSDLVKDGEMGSYPVTERFYEIGKPQGLNELDVLLRSAAAAQI
jgi:NDP-sugar pyrophosphorylase family protein